jgi:hypothetical protein
MTQVVAFASIQKPAVHRNNDECDAKAHLASVTSSTV